MGESEVMNDVPTQGKIFRRRNKILEAVKTEPKSFKRIAKELKLSNSLIKADIHEMVAHRQLKDLGKGVVCRAN